MTHGPANLQQRLDAGCRRAVEVLLQEATPAGHWVGELSTSALSTATAVTALSVILLREPQRTPELQPLIDGGLNWLAEQQNADGGWGDTTLSFSNISTTMLAHAAFHAAGATARHSPLLARSQAYIDAAGGAEAVRKRYGKDKTFSVPILTQCAIAGLIDWREIPSLPFELGVLPHKFYQWIQLPVVSYALPALIAIGQVRHMRGPSWNPLTWWLRQAAGPSTLKLLTAIQPTSGGFLEAAPLTSFVTMSLASMGRADHPVARKGLQFLIESVRPDGSWPIDTNLATWVTTLAVNALPEGELPAEQGGAIADWLLGQQYRTVHPYTQAAPGGWAWTNLTGGVPDADDTPGAILAVLKLCRGERMTPAVAESLAAAVTWLVDLQNRDGGWPTFCRGWGALPFDRSSNDISAHAMRALLAWLKAVKSRQDDLARRVERALAAGWRFLEKHQRADGSWLPLWFGNQYVADDENPLYGTAKVLLAWRDAGRLGEPAARRALDWLKSSQSADGGWGGAAGAPSSVEETALALEALLAEKTASAGCLAGLDWLLARVEDGSFVQTAPIGFYFAKLWYFERLYPIIFTVGALSRARAVLQSDCSAPEPMGTGRRTEEVIAAFSA